MVNKYGGLQACVLGSILFVSSFTSKSSVVCRETFHCGFKSIIIDLFIYVLENQPESEWKIVDA